MENLIRIKSLARFLSIAFLSFLFISCSTSVEEMNKPALFWYERMIIAITDGDLERADNFFNSLQSEHISSPLIQEALILLAKAHMEKNEHLLAGFFASEYKTRYSNVNNVDYIAFLGIETNYYAFGNYAKDQGFINSNISNISGFVLLNKNNKYLPYIRHILTAFRLSQLEINKGVIGIYNMKDKEEAVKIYQQKNEELGVNDIEYTPSNIPWYVRIFSW